MSRVHLGELDEVGLGDVALLVPQLGRTTLVQVHLGGWLAGWLRMAGSEMIIASGSLNTCTLTTYNPSRPAKRRRLRKRRSWNLLAFGKSQLLRYFEVEITTNGPDMLFFLFVTIVISPLLCEHFQLFAKLSPLFAGLNPKTMLGQER